MSRRRTTSEKSGSRAVKAGRDDGASPLPAELGVLQLVSLGGMLATLHAFVRIAERPSVRRGVALAVAFAATSLMCGYYALSLSVLVLLGGGWLLADRLKEWETWKALGVALFVGLAILVPVTGQQLRIAERYELERSASTASRFSASWEDYGRTPWAQLVPAPGVDTAERPGGHAFWPGTVKVCLALAGIVWGFGWGPRRWTGFYTTVLVLGFWLSFGPGDGGPSLHRLLVSAVPGYAQLRSPFRFAVFVELMVALLATAGGLAFIHARARLPLVWRSLAVLLLGALAAMEIRPTQQHLLPIPNLEAQLPWLAWVESETSPGDALAFLPFPQGRGVEDYMETTQWMFWQMRHRRPTVNGYSGFFPRRFRELKAALEHFPDARSLEHRAKRGVRYYVVLRGVYPEDDIEAVAISTHRLRRVFGDDVAKLDVYELVGTPQAATRVFNAGRLCRLFRRGHRNRPFLLRGIGLKGSALDEVCKAQAVRVSASPALLLATRHDFVAIGVFEHPLELFVAARAAHRRMDIAFDQSQPSVSYEFAAALTDRK